MASRRYQIQKNQKLYCNKEITYGTKKFNVGDVFPYKKLMVPWRRVVDMFSSMKLIGENDKVFEHVMELKRKRLAKTSTKKATLKNKARGWWDVVVDGKIVNKKALRKPEAEQMMEEYNV